MTKKRKRVWQTIAFFAGLIILVARLQRIFRVEENLIYQLVEGFYEEPANSLDAVYIGSSTVFTFWQAPLAWGDYGYAVYPLSVPNMPARAIKYMLEEARKTQPDALYIINLNALKTTEITEQYMHYLADYMHLSPTKLRMVWKLSDEMGLPVSDRLEYFLPMIRFHSGWSNLRSRSFGRVLNGMKGGAGYSRFLKKSVSLKTKYTVTDERVPLTDEQLEAATELMIYCREEGINALFVIVPQAIGDTEQIGQLHTIADLVASEGFDVLDLLNEVDGLGLDLSEDFYNRAHTNIHGSVKYTYFLGMYLRQNYDFDDKRGNPDYADWDEAYEKYVNTISGYATDFELLHEKRDRSLAAPELSVSSSADSAALNWSRTENADGYLVYRKSSRKGAKAWEKIASVDSAVTAYTDTGLEADTTYWYTVVPVCQRDGELRYGKYDMTGETVEILKEDNDK